jgi:methionine aminotransferase
MAPAALTDEIRRVHQFTVFTVVTPVQQALAVYLERHPEFYLQLAAFYQQKRDYFCALLAETRFRLLPTASTFFQVVDYSAISQVADVELARDWTRNLGVASIPISVFFAGGAPGHLLRFCFAKDDVTLAAAVERLAEL